MSELQEPLLPFLSAATKILLTDTPFSVDNGEETSESENLPENGEKVGESELTTEIGGAEGEVTAGTKDGAGPEEGEIKGETVGDENVRAVGDEEGENLIENEVRVHDSGGKGKAQNLINQSISTNKESDATANSPELISCDQAVDNEASEVDNENRTVVLEDNHQHGKSIVNVESEADKNFDSSSVEENKIQLQSDDRGIQTASKDHVEEFSDSTKLEELPQVEIENDNCVTKAETTS